MGVYEEELRVKPVVDTGQMTQDVIASMERIRAAAMESMRRAYGIEEESLVGTMPMTEPSRGRRQTSSDDSSRINPRAAWEGAIVAGPRSTSRGPSDDEVTAAKRRVEQLSLFGQQRWIAERTATAASAAKGSSALTGDQDFLQAGALQKVMGTRLMGALDATVASLGSWATEVLGTARAQGRLLEVLTQQVAVGQADVQAEARLSLARQALALDIAKQNYTASGSLKAQGALVGQMGRNVDVEAQTLALRQLTDALVAASVAADRDAASTDELASVRAVSRLHTADLTKATNQHVDELRKARGETPSLFQAFRHSARGPGASGSALDEQKLGQFMGIHTMNTLGYAVPGIAIGLGFEAFRKALEQSQEAQRSMAELKAQFSALGQSDQFGGFAQSVKNIASSTGVAISEVTQLAMAMKGVYGDTQQATVATQAITQATVTMGLSMQQVQADFIGISQGFTDLQAQGPQAMTTIQNELLHLQDITGVQAKTLAPGVADVASTAGIAGFSFNQTASMIAAAQQHTGLSDASIGQTLSKIITSLFSNPQLLTQTEGLLQAVPGTNLPKNLSSQSVTSQLQSVMQGMNKLGQISPAEYSYVLSQLGINASAIPSANALFASGGEAQNLAKSPAPADRAQEEFNKQMSTLFGKIKQLEADFSNLGISILDSGFGKLITEATGALGGFVKVLSEVNGATGGLVGDVAAIGAVVLAISGLYKTVVILKGALDILTAATTADAEAQTLNAETGVGAMFSKAGGFLGIGGGAAAVEGGDLLAAGGGSRLLALAPVLAPVAAAVAVHMAANNVIKQHPNDRSPGTLIAQNIVNLGNPLAATHGPNAGKGWNKQMGWSKHLDHNLSNWWDDAKGLVNRNVVAPVDHFLGTNLSGLNGKSTTAPSLSPVEQMLNTAATNPQVHKYLQGQLATAIKTTDLAGVSAAYETGQLSAAQALSTLEKNTSDLMNEFQNNPSQAAWEQYLQAQQQLNQMIQQQAQNALSTISSLTQQGSVQALAAYRQAVVNVMYATGGHTSPEAAMQQANQILSSAQQTIQANVANQTDPLKALEAQRAGYNLTPDELAAYNFAQGLNNPKYKPVSSLFVPGQAVTSSQANQAYQQEAAATQGLSSAQAFEDPVKVAQAALTAAQSNLQNFQGDKTGADYRNLQAASVNAQNQLTDAQRAVTSAQDSYYQAVAQAVGNNMAAASYAVRVAQDAVNAAHGAAEKLKAQGQLAQANMDLAKATIAYADSLSSVSQAVFTSQGNPIAAAYAKYQQDVKDAASMAAAIRKNGGDPAQSQDYQNLIAAQFNDLASYQQTLVSTLSQSTDTQLFLGQITAVQAIAQLRGALSKVQGNTLETQALLSDIRQIQNSAGANLNFDLPTTLVNATLYQARAIESGVGPIAGAASTGPVTVNINVNGDSAASVNSAVSALTAAVAGQQRTGTLGPILNG